MPALQELLDLEEGFWRAALVDAFAQLDPELLAGTSSGRRHLASVAQPRLTDAVNQ